jgi:putative flavoprotein involved in K+ transport
MRADIQRSGDALIGIPERSIAEAGVVRVGRLDAERGGMPVCGDAVIKPRAVIWCTGFQPDYAWIDLPAFDATGRPLHVRGGSTAMPGLFFLGLRFQHRLNSSLIGGVGEDAAFIAEQVALRSHAMLPA